MGAAPSSAGTNSGCCTCKPGNTDCGTSVTGVPCNEGVVVWCYPQEDISAGPAPEQPVSTSDHLGAGLKDVREIKLSMTPASASQSPKQMEMKQEYNDREVVEPATAAAVAAGAQSKSQARAKDPRVWGERLDEANTLDMTWWAVYLICCGCGTSPEVLRPLEWDCTCICCHTLIRSAPLTGRYDQVCSCMQTCIGFTALAIVPPHQAHPRCVLCSQNICGRHGGTYARRDKSLEWIEYDGTLEQFVPCYMGCCGCAGVPDLIAIAATYLKCCCCTCKNDVVMPEPASLATVLVNGGCLMAQCHFPPDHVGNPMLACCGRRYIKV